MIDLHCHFLPGIDDGANTKAEALELARASVENGIRCAIMTPHLHPGRHENTKQIIAQHTEQFRAALKQAGIPLRIGFAAEVRLAPETLPLLDSGQVPFLGELDGYRIMLLEFPHSHIPLGADKLVQRLLDQKIRPLIAHPERNKDIMRNIDKITPFIEMGCMLQLTAAAVANRFGEKAYRRAIQLLESDAPLVLATDAHNLKSRAPILREGLEVAATIVGHKAANDMVNTLPMRIISSQFNKLQQADAPMDKSTVNKSPRLPTIRLVEPATAKANPQPTVPTAAPNNSTNTISNDQLQATIQQHIEAALPGAIENFLKEKLLLDLEKELLPTIRNSFGDSLQRDLANLMQEVLTVDVRSNLLASIIQDARNQACEEFKNRYKQSLQQSLIDELIDLLKRSSNYEDANELISHFQKATHETH